MNLVLIRHSMTEGNLKRRYIGRKTDEPLCSKGIELAKRQAKRLKALVPEYVFVSPMLRCRETASILFPNLQQIIVPDLAECDFGKFEGKNFRELSGDEDYQSWIDSGGMLPFPEGESREEFVRRCCKAFQNIVHSYLFETAAVVAHGGTFMAALSELEESHTPYFDWRLPHCVPLSCYVLQKEPLKLRYDKSGRCGRAVDYGGA